MADCGRRHAESERGLKVPWAPGYNVTIQNLEITATGYYAIQYGRDNQTVTGLKVLHSTIHSVANCCDYAIQPLSSGTFEFGWNNIYAFKDGIDVNTGYLHDN